MADGTEEPDEDDPEEQLARLRALRQRDAEPGDNPPAPRRRLLIRWLGAAAALVTLAAIAVAVVWQWWLSSSSSPHPTPGTGGTPGSGTPGAGGSPTAGPTGTHHAAGSGSRSCQTPTCRTQSCGSGCSQSSNGCDSTSNGCGSNGNGCGSSGSGCGSSGNGCDSSGNGCGSSGNGSSGGGCGPSRGGSSGGGDSCGSSSSHAAGLLPPDLPATLAHTALHLPGLMSRTGVATRLGAAAIRWYRRRLSPSLPARCRYEPSCSRYALAAIERYGLLAGAPLAVARIRRCTPDVPPGTSDPLPVSRLSAAPACR